MCVIIANFKKVKKGMKNIKIRDKNKKEGNFKLINIVLFLGFVLITVIILSGEVSAANSTFYVDNNHGSDANNGSSQYPWKTINYAASKVHPGDTVLISNGTYSINQNIHITTSGSKSSPIKFKGAVNGTIIDASRLDGSIYDKRDAIFLDNADYVTIENLEIKNAFRAGIRVSQSDYVSIKGVKSHDNGKWGIFTDFSNHVLIENCEAYGSKDEHGIYVSNSGDYPLIRGNKIHDNAACGLHMNGDISMGGDGIISGALVENNIIYNNGMKGGSGINCDGVRNSIIRNNLLYNNHASGISLYCIDGGASSNNNLVYHNTVIVASDGRWALNLKDSSSQNKIYNNILLNNNTGRGSINTDSTNGLQSDYNVITTNSHPVTPDDDGTYPSFSQWQALGFDKHSIRTTSDQLFVNHSQNNYALKNGSPAIDKGTSLYSYFRDIKGNNRPQGNGYDIGAYEYATNGNSIPPTASAYPKGGLYNTNKAVTLKMSKPGSIYYTLNGSTPTTASTKYLGSIKITKTTILKFIAVDLSGNKSPVYTQKYTIDKTAPKVTSTNPKKKATRVSRTRIIAIKFSEKLKASVNWSKIMVKNIRTGKKVKISKLIKSNILYLKMSSKRYAYNWYQVYIPAYAVKDYAGNKLAARYTFKFKTGRY